LGTNFAFSAPIPREIGKNEDVYFINSDMIGQLQCQWIQICRIMDSDNHYLRLPAQRLIDGGLRDRPEDAILDYAIGLERLLTGSARYELKFRFALTGATILSWYGGHKHLFFNKLKRFYDLRSAIIHGNEVDQADLKDMRSMGEDYLRKIWWWYLINGFTEARNGLTKGTDKIMDRILSDSTNGRPCRGIRHELETEN